MPNGIPIGFVCSGSVACTINGVSANPAGGGGWYIPASVDALVSDYNDPATTFTYRVVFSLDENYTTCSGVVYYVDVNLIGETWPITITGKSKSYLEDDRNRRKSKNKLVFGTTTFDENECPVAQEEEALLDYFPGSYNSDNFTFPPASLGWGWTLQYNKMVVEDPSNEDMVFYDGSGSFERWKLSAGSYVARYANNYETLAINGSSQVVITTKDKRVLTLLEATLGGRLMAGIAGRLPDKEKPARRPASIRKVGSLAPSHARMLAVGR